MQRIHSIIVKFLLVTIIKSNIYRIPMTQDIKELRNEISSIDQEILILLSKRMNLAGEVAEYKLENWLPIFDPIREKEILEKYSKIVDFDIHDIYQAIMDESKRLQQEKLKRTK